MFTIPNVYYISVRLGLQYVKYLVAKTLNVLRLRSKPAVFIRQPIDRFYSPAEGKRLLEGNGLRVVYAETCLSKRQNFRITRVFPTGNVRKSIFAFDSNFALYVCEKKNV